jgi:uncharacterized Zn finger protein (UPF0148 family)
MYCRYCGAKLSDGAVFCWNCGDRVPSVEADIRADEKTETSKSDLHLQTEKEESVITEQLDDHRTDTWNTSPVELDYEKLYQFSEQGVKPNIYDKICDLLFGGILRLKIVRVTGCQLALIFKKYFIDPCDEVDMINYFRRVTRINVMGKGFTFGSMVFYNRGGYGWIKDCDARIIWEPRSTIDGSDSSDYRRTVKKMLDAKELELSQQIGKKEE